jgi:hypothetical protein
MEIQWFLVLCSTFGNWKPPKSIHFSLFWGQNFTNKKGWIAHVAFIKFHIIPYAQIDQKNRVPCNSICPNWPKYLRKWMKFHVIPYAKIIYSKTSKNVKYRLRGPHLVVEKDIYGNSKQPPKNCGVLPWH